MELQLKQETFPYYEVLRQAPWTFEITQEAIVPDYCADVERIVDVFGCSLLHSKELLPDGRLELCGVMKTTVLFLSEGEQTVRALHLSLPIHSYYDCKASEEEQNIAIAVRVKRLDARLLNPRKLLVRGENLVEAIVFSQKQLSFCGAAEEKEGLQALYDTTEVSLITSVLEREFSYTDELTLSAARPAMEEILATHTELTDSECRVMGNRLVLKGIAKADVLYKDENGALATLQQEFLFSQVVPYDGAEDACSVRCRFDLTGFEYTMGKDSGGDEQRTVTMTLHNRSMIEVIETKRLTYLTDLYSICAAVNLERQSLPLQETGSVGTKKQALRELISTGKAVKDVIWSNVACIGWCCQSGEHGSLLEGQLRLRCLYLDENSAICAGENTVTIKAETELSSRECMGISVRPVGEIVSSPAADGVELRFSLVFLIEQGSVQTKTTVCRAEVVEEETLEPMPSLVLRKFSQGLKLWDIAKTYRTTTAAILSANDLESENDIPEDCLLLIPRYK